MIDLYNAILSHPKYSHLIHDIDFEIRNDGYGQYIAMWNTSVNPPNSSEIADGWNIFCSLQYRERRAAEYPPIGDQLDAIWKVISDLNLGSFRDDATQMLNLIQEVKAKYPKPINGG